MRRSMLISVAGMFLAAVSTPVWADTPARPGTLNYIEGQAAMGGQSLDGKSVGVELGEGQSITTLDGKVEILLTPGVFCAWVRIVRLSLSPRDWRTYKSSSIRATR